MTKRWFNRQTGRWVALQDDFEGQDIDQLSAAARARMRMRIEAYVLAHPWAGAQRQSDARRQAGDDDRTQAHAW